MARRRSILVLPAPAVFTLALLAMTPHTAAAAIGEVQPLTLRGEPECVRASGAPGEIALPAKGGVRFVRATRDGLTPGETVRAGESSFDCPQVVVRPGGAGVIVARDGTKGLTAVIRDAGGQWGAVVPLVKEERWAVEQVSAAVSDRGDVLVVWRENREDSRAATTTYRFRAVRRAAGGTFGAPETIGTPGPRNELILPAVAATGETFVLTTRVDGARPPFRVPVSVATAAPGAPFGAPTPVATMPWLSAPSLVAAPDGRAIVVVPDGRSVLVAERPPGGAFGAPAAIGLAGAGSWILTSASLGAGGEAAVGWVHALAATAGLATRSAPGPFGAPVPESFASLIPDGYDPFFASQTFIASFAGPAGFTTYGAPFGATALTPDGRALFAWYEDERAPSRPRLLTAPLAGGPVSSEAGGRGLATPEAFPLVLADGTPALVWVESEDGSPVSASDSTRYTLRVAVEGVTPRPSPPTPRVTVGAPRSRVLGREGTLRLPVRCSGPCEVRGEVSAGATDVVGTVRLTRAGRGTLALRGAAIALTAPRGQIAIRLSYRALGGTEAQARTVRVALARPAGAPDARVRDLRAVRRGAVIRVTWRTAGNPGGDSGFFVTAATSRSRTEEPGAFRSVNSRRGRRAYAVTLRGSADLRWVTVRSIESLVSGRPATVRVR